jgi:chromate reductase, NAD(P)H dehydrogenase (quinone)
VAGVIAWIVEGKGRPMTRYKIGYLVGSLAKASINRKLARALIRLAPEGMEFKEIPFKDLPLYSYDYDDDFPQVARDFKDAITASDAILFVTPEYNRSIPGGLKNAIDWASRPYGKNAFTRKPSAVIGTSPGSIGTALAQQSLRGVLSFCNAPQMNAPEAYVPAQLHGTVPHLHRPRAHRAAAGGVRTIGRDPENRP